MKIDRMDLADLGNPVALAQAILNQLPDLTPPVPILEIAYALGILKIEPINSTGFEGGLIAQDDKVNGCIVYNEMSPPTRQRFTISHELGHFVNPWHTSGAEGKFMCTSKDMVARDPENNQKNKMEVEANQFAAELLMPTAWIKNETRLKAPEIAYVRALSTKYDVSKETMARRYVDFQEEPCALIFSRNGKVSYSYSPQPTFPRLSVYRGDSIPKNSLTMSYNDDVGSSSDWREYPSDLWLSGKASGSVYEQVMIQQDGYRMTFLTLGDGYEDVGDEEELVEAWKPKF